MQGKYLTIHMQQDRNIVWDTSCFLSNSLRFLQKALTVLLDIPPQQLSYKYPVIQDLATYETMLLRLHSKIPSEPKKAQGISLYPQCISVAIKQDSNQLVKKKRSTKKIIIPYSKDLS